MSGRAPAIEDADFIQRRIAEIRAAEDAARAGCSCPEAIDALGRVVKLHAATCSLRTEAALTHYGDVLDKLRREGLTIGARNNMSFNEMVLALGDLARVTAWYEDARG